ncbi:hypothetical protein [uncultured Gordonia sp.]|nr:hypothetical protein [uncultured Gordonia sp.]
MSPAEGLLRLPLHIVRTAQSSSYTALRITSRHYRPLAGPGAD